jgi:hypothetical protein
MVKMKEVCNEIDCGQKGRCFTTQVGLRDCSTDAILRESFQKVQTNGSSDFAAVAVTFVTLAAATTTRHAQRRHSVT